MGPRVNAKAVRTGNAGCSDKISAFFIAGETAQLYKKHILMDNLVYVIVAIVLLLAAAIGVVVYRRKYSKEEEEELHFQCPCCSRRLRYRPKQAGHKGACPRCRESFVFPGDPKPSSSR
jgi:hypothetical protein